MVRGRKKEKRERERERDRERERERDREVHVRVTDFSASLPRSLLLFLCPLAATISHQRAFFFLHSGLVNKGMAEIKIGYTGGTLRVEN